MTDLTDEEIKALRKLLEQKAEIAQIVEEQKRFKWLMSGIRTSASWIAIVLGGLFLGWESLVKLIKGAAGQ